jgi:hypothetical protein
MEDPESIDLFIEKKKKKHDNRITVRRDFQVHINSPMWYYMVHALYMF